MKISNMVIIGVIVLGFLVVPVIGADAGMDAVLSPLPAGVSSPAVQGITPAVAYNQYFYMWNHGVNCITSLPNPGVSYVWTDFKGHLTMLNPAPATPPYYSAAFVHCPMATISSYTGRHPYIRYGMIQYNTSSSLGAKIVRIDFYSGQDFVKLLPENAYSTPVNGQKMELNWDLGAYYDFQRGMNMIVYIQNTDAGALRGMMISGYGAKGEFNA